MRREGPDEKTFEVEQLCRMRRLVWKCNVGLKLYELNLAGQGIGEGGQSAVTALATVLMEKIREKDTWITRSCYLQSLSLSNNGLTDDDVMILSPMLKKCVRLERLYLDDNNIGEVGCATLCRSLPDSLKFLDLTKNGMGDDACMALCRSLPAHVEDLLLFNNNMGPEGCRELLKLFRRPNNELECLFVDGNPGANKVIKQQLTDKVNEVRRDWYMRVKKFCGFNSDSPGVMQALVCFLSIIAFFYP